MKIFKKRIKGFSLVELVVAIGIFAIISPILIMLVVDSTKTFNNIRTRSQASQLTQDVNNALILLKTQGWFNIVTHTDSGPKFLEFVNGQYEIFDGEKEFGGLNYSFTIDRVFRDESRTIVTEGGTLDPHTRLISVSINWTDFLGKVNTINPKLYINDWETNTIVQTTATEFNQGTNSNTIVVNNDGGEVRLISVLYPDWCNPQLALHEYNIPGNANARSILAKPGHAYLGTRGSTTGEPFTKLNIEGVAPPILSVEGTYSGHTVNDIFVIDDYAFLATATDNREVLILDISSVPYTEIGYFDAPGSTDGYSVYVDGNVGYLSQGRIIRSFDLSSYYGSRSLIGSRTVGWFIASIPKIHVQDGYLYAVLDWDWYELAILNVQNPSNMPIISQTSVNNQQVYDMYVSKDATRVYFGTNNSSSEHEFFILDTTQKTGSRPIIASLDGGGTTIRGITVIEDANIVILVGTGAEEYSVYRINDEQNPTYCGGMQLNNGIYEIDSITDEYGNAFSYIITGDTENEFKIIRGGPGGGGEYGYGYVPSGTYTSSILDTESDSPQYLFYSLVYNIPENTNLRLQFRANSTTDMGSTQWIGPDGTQDTYFLGTEYEQLPSSLLGRYIQYRAFFESNGTNTPLLEEIIINYEK